MLEISSLHKSFGPVEALRGVSLTLGKGETLGLVGESGSGKSTLARCLVRLVEPTSGAIRFNGTDIATLSGKELLRFRRCVQMVFQDPFSSLSPRMTVEVCLREPLDVHGLRNTRPAELLRLVGLGEEKLSRYPHELSGGERQRIGIARALAVGPELLVCDEPVSALDVSIGAQILSLLAELHARLGLALLLISHDLRVVRRHCHRTAVLYRGEIVEEGETARLFASPAHPYTRTLLAAVPKLR